MTPGQLFMVMLAGFFILIAYTTVRENTTTYLAITTAVMWLAVGVGWFIKIGIEVFK